MKTNSSVSAGENQPIKTIENLVKVLSVNGIIQKKLDFNKEQLLLETVTSFANYINKIEKVGDIKIIINGKSYLREPVDESNVELICPNCGNIESVTVINGMISPKGHVCFEKEGENLSSHKIFYIDDVSELVKQYLNKQITIAKLTERLNEIAQSKEISLPIAGKELFEWVKASDELPPDDSDRVHVRRVDNGYNDCLPVGFLKIHRALYEWLKPLPTDNSKLINEDEK